MKYYENLQNQIYAYDETDPSQHEYIIQAIQNGWTDISNTFDPAPTQEQIANGIKGKRDGLLYQSDWTQIPNNPLTSEKQQEWATYRQQLRDITNQPGFPENVVWPTKPE